VVALLLFSWPMFAQDVLQSLGRNDALTGAGTVAGAGTVDIANLPYTIRSGDFRLLIAPSLEVDWNDNINGSSSAAVQDYIVEPAVQFTGSYPVTVRNILTLSAGIGYAEYLEHPIYNGVRINEGSQLAFDVFIKDFRINFHDSATDTQDTGAQGAVAGTAFYGGFNNHVGVTGIWNLRDFVLTLGFDHNNYFPSSSTFSYLDSASENPLAQAGFHIRPNLTAGVETTASFTSYSGEVLNNSQNYSAGLYASWKPDSFFAVNVRGGYSLYDFNQTSQSTGFFLESPTGAAVAPPSSGGIRTANQNSYYAALTLSHNITQKISYGVNINHEIVPGVQSDANELTSVGASGSWSITKAVSLSSSVGYQHGQQGVGNISGNLNETYDFVNGTLSAGYNITTAMMLRLTYRRASRLSTVEAGGYGQDLVSLTFTYRFL
jgi:hypothetical protein